MTGGYRSMLIATLVSLLVLCGGFPLLKRMLRRPAAPEPIAPVQPARPVLYALPGGGKPRGNHGRAQLRLVTTIKMREAPEERYGA